MSLLIAGEISQSKHEWFWHFNKLLHDKLRQSNHDVRLVTPSGKNQSGYNTYDVFGDSISFNLNNILIGNEDTKKILMFTTFFDLRQLCGRSCNIPSENLVGIYSGHYDEKIIDRDCGNIKHLLKPWLFRPWRSNDMLIEDCYQPENNNIYFRGLFIPGIRDVITSINDISSPGVDIKGVKEKDYQTKLPKARVGFSVSGIRDMCNRDVELWAAGIPFIRPRFTSKLMIDIPDDVYIPVDWEPNYNALTPIPADKEKLAADIINKFNEVKDDHEYLNQIGQNGYEFYKQHFTMEKIIQNSYNILLKEELI